MSLDIRLKRVQLTEVFSANITHNLTDMADAAGIYKALWRPEEIGVAKAGQLIPILREGLTLLESDPERFKKFDSPNGWGLYIHFVPFVQKVLAACEEFPDAYGAFSCEGCGRLLQPGETSYPVRELYGPVKHYHKNCRPVAEEKP